MTFQPGNQNHRVPFPKKFLAYLSATAFILGLLRWAGVLSLLTCTLAWLAGALVCITWAFEETHKEIEQLRQEVTELRDRGSLRHAR